MTFGCERLRGGGGTRFGLARARDRRRRRHSLPTPRLVARLMKRARARPTYASN